MPIELWLAFVAAAAVLLIIPGPTRKGIVFFVAFLPQFLRPQVAVTQQSWVLSLYAAFAGSAARLLAKRPA